MAILLPQGSAGATLAPAGLPPLPLPGASELGDGHGLVELGDGTEDLAHRSSGRRIVNERCRAVGGDDLFDQGVDRGIGDAGTELKIALDRRIDQDAPAEERTAALAVNPLPEVLAARAPGIFLMQDDKRYP